MFSNKWLYESFIAKYSKDEMKFDSAARQPIKQQYFIQNVVVQTSKKIKKQGSEPQHLVQKMSVQYVLNQSNQGCLIIRMLRALIVSQKHPFSPLSVLHIFDSFLRASHLQKALNWSTCGSYGSGTGRQKSLNRVAACGEEEDGLKRLKSF